MKKHVIESIAAVAHEVNKAYCEAIGDQTQVPWDAAPQWQRDSAIESVKLHLDNPDAGPAAGHEAWKAHKVAEGWVCGPVKDPTKKEHPCIVPFYALPLEQQIKDYIFRGVVHAIAREMVRSS